MNIQEIGLLGIIYGIMFIFPVTIIGMFFADDWSEERRDRVKKRYFLFLKIYAAVSLLMATLPYVFKAYGGADSLVLGLVVFSFIGWLWRLR